MWEVIFVVAIGLLFIGMGVAITKFKWYWLIAGYNTASKEEKKHVDIKQLGKHMGRLCYIIAVGIWITGLLVHFFEMPVSISTIVMGIIIFGYVIYMQKFDSSEDIKSNRVIISVIGGIFLLIMIVTASVGSTPNEISKKTGKIVISGNYGITIKDEDVKSIELIETMPKVLLRTGGSSNGKIKSGNFKLEGDVEVKLYLQSKEGPYIKIVTDKQDIYINNKDKEKIKKIYAELINP